MLKCHKGKWSPYISILSSIFHYQLYILFDIIYNVIELFQTIVTLHALLQSTGIISTSVMQAY